LFTPQLPLQTGTMKLFLLLLLISTALANPPAEGPGKGESNRWPRTAIICIPITFLALSDGQNRTITHHFPIQSKIVLKFLQNDGFLNDSRSCGR
jgi:hypothetical protein